MNSHIQGSSNMALALARLRGVPGMANAAGNTRQNPPGHMLLNRRQGEAREHIRPSIRRARPGHILLRNRLWPEEAIPKHQRPDNMRPLR